MLYGCHPTAPKIPNAASKAAHHDAAKHEPHTIPTSISTSNSPLRDEYKWPPPPPAEILRKWQEYKRWFCPRWYHFPFDPNTDHPYYALYRIYAHITIDNHIDMRNELEDFWHQPWSVADIPDPVDYDEPERYTVLACIPDLLVQAFNKRIEGGLPRDAPAIQTLEQMDQSRARPKIYESVPEWTQKVPPLEKTLRIPHDDFQVIEDMDDDRAEPAFKEKNILVWKPHIHFR